MPAIPSATAGAARPPSPAQPGAAALRPPKLATRQLDVLASPAKRLRAPCTMPALCAQLSPAARALLPLVPLLPLLFESLQVACRHRCPPWQCP